VLGSVQDVSTQAGHSCMMLRWRAPSDAEVGAMKLQVRASLARFGINVEESASSE